MIIGRKRTSIIKECPGCGAHENLIVVKKSRDGDTEMFSVSRDYILECVSCCLSFHDYSNVDLEKFYHEGDDL